MKSIPKLYISISFIILVLLLASIWFFNQASYRDKLQELRRITVANFEQEFDSQKANLLNLGLALSEDGDLKEALLEGNQLKGNIVLYKISDRFSENTAMQKLRLQLITPSLEIFAENWKSSRANVPLREFRNDLKKIKDTQLAKVGIETGRRLTFKATIPIRNNNNNKLIGYLEVIQFIDEFAKKLRQQGIELLALMDKNYIIDDSLMKGFPLLKGYVIANENFNSKIKEKADAFSWKALERLSYYEHDGTFFMLKDMLNGEGLIIGKYLLVLPKEKFLSYKKSYQNASIITRFSDDDVYNYVKNSDKSMGLYSSAEDKKFYESLAELPKEDRDFVKESTKVKLQEYSKDELIDMILKETHRDERLGEIR